MLRFQDVRRYYYYCIEGYDRVALDRREDHTFEVLGREFVPVNREGYHLLRAEVEGDCITCSFDARPVIVAFDDRYTHGPAGIRSNAVASYKGVRVTTTRVAHDVAVQTRDAAERALADLRETYPCPAHWKTVPLDKGGLAGELQLGKFGDGRGRAWRAYPATRTVSRAGSLSWTFRATCSGSGRARRT